MSTRPAVGATSRLIMRSSVDLPEPEVPTTTAIVALADRDGHVVDHDVVAVALGEVLDLDHARAPSGQIDDRIEHDGGGEGQGHGRHGPEQHEVHGRLADALEHERAEAPAADQRRDRGEAEILHQHDADAGEDDGKRQRQLDPHEPLRGDMPMPRAASTTAAGTWLEAHHRVGHHRQQRIEEQRHEGRRRADAADAERGGERHVRRELAERRHQDAEQRDARDRLDDVEALQDRRCSRRRTRWHSMPSGSPTRQAAGSEPRASKRCWRRLAPEALGPVSRIPS